MNLTHTIIKTDAQYNRYCNKLEDLISSNKKTKACQDEIELLTLLIKTYDEAHSSITDADPVELLKTLMKSHQLKSVDLAKLLGVSEGLVSDILHYKKGFSKETIRILSERFKLNQMAFNRPYSLVVQAKSRSKNSSRKAA
jgi:HTH-type transcriptional regulator/antitoxin HigA